MDTCGCIARARWTGCKRGAAQKLGIRQRGIDVVFWSVLKRRAASRLRVARCGAYRAGSRSNRWSTTLRKKIQPQNRRKARRKSLLFLPSQRRRQFLPSRLRRKRRTRRRLSSQWQRNHPRRRLFPRDRLRRSLLLLRLRLRRHLEHRLRPAPRQPLRHRKLLLLRHQRKKLRRSRFPWITNWYNG